MKPLVSLSLLAWIFANASSVAPIDTVRLSLEACSAFWFGVVKYAGYSVAIGCLLEAPETLKTIKRWRSSRRRPTPEVAHAKEEEAEGRAVVFAALGLLLIFIGIVVETFAEGKVSDIDALLRTHESEKISAAEHEAASATLNAGQAECSAHIASDAAASAVGDVNTVKSTADTAAASARKARDLSEENEELANNLHRDLLKVGPRSWLLTGTNQHALITALTPFSTQKIDIRYCSYELPSAPAGTDSEVIQLFTLLYGVLTFGSHWEGVIPQGDARECVHPGIRISTDPTAPVATNSAADALARQLSLVGLESTRVIQSLPPRPPHSDVYIFQGVLHHVFPLTSQVIVVGLGPHP